MTNVLRTIGKLPAVLTLICDLAKAVAAIEISKYIFHTLPFNETAMVGAYFGGICVVLGHIFPIFFGFKGGKAVATCLGVMLVCNFPAAIIAIVVFLLLLLSSRIVSLSSIIAVASMLVTVPNYQMSGVLPFVLNANGPIGANFVILIFKGERKSSPFFSEKWFFL